MSTESAYLFLLSENAVSPHCMEKFFPLFDSRYWSFTWCQLFFFHLDRPVIDCVGRFPIGSFTRLRGLLVLVMLSLLLVFVLLIWSHFSICFSTVLWWSVSCLGFGLLCLWLLLFVVPSWFVTFSLVSRLMSCLQFLGFLFICCLFANFVFGGLGMIFALGVSRLLMSWNVSSLVFGFIFLCFSVASGLTAVVVILFVSGALVVWWLCYVMTLWLSIFSFLFCVALACPGRFSGVNQRLGIG